MTYRYTFHLPHKYKLRGFEEELALMELRILGQFQPERQGDKVFIESKTPIAHGALERLTFYEKVETEEDSKQVVIIPYQALIDRTAKAVRFVSKVDNSRALLNLVERIENGRREHTYLTHSYHQYKGKYYPQLVKSLLNYSGIGPRNVVLDPFAGSGTTLVECFINGISSVGVDLNPLAVLMSNVKTHSLKLNPEQVEVDVKNLARRLKRSFRHYSLWDLGIEDFPPSSPPKLEYDKLIHFLGLPNVEYLLQWFPQETLAKLGLILREIGKLESSILQDLCRLTLSNLVRGYSLQEPTQLRIRRRRDSPPCDDILLKFFRSLKENIAAIHLYHAVKPRCPTAQAEAIAYQGDIRDLKSIPSPLLNKDGQIDAVITSPPYATALPYIDTDRLSLFLLGLLTTDQRWKLEGEMIGNREIKDKQRQSLEDEFTSSYETNPLPASIKELIHEVFTRNQKAQVGFRRKNMASLLFKYFVDMQKAFAEVYRVLRPGGLFFVVIGNSTTTAGGKLVEIPTDQFLIEIGKSIGFTLDVSLPMTDQAAYMIHSKNMIRTETIFGLRKPNE